MNFISQDLYNEILKSMPILCVDGIIKNERNEILFLKRLNEPEKGRWWLPGGRVIKNEMLTDSIIRKVKQETSLDTEIVKMVGITETIFEKGKNDIPTHTINVTFLLEIKGGGVEIDSDHSDYIWSNDIDSLSLNQDLKKIFEKL